MFKNAYACVFLTLLYLAMIYLCIYTTYIYYYLLLFIYLFIIIINKNPICSYKAELLGLH
jgi:hypothetical protein